MPNLEAAASLIPDAESPSPEPTIADAIAQGIENAGITQTESPDATGEAVAEQPAEPSPAESRAAEMRARIERIKAQAAEKAEFKRLESLKSEISRAREEAERAQAEARAARDNEVARWQAALKNPVAGFKELGLDPQDAYRQITEAVLEDEKPERAQKKLVESIIGEKLKEIEPKLSKVQELEAQLEAFRKAEEEREKAAIHAESTRAEREFVKIVRSNGYDLLADYYDDDELIPIGHAVANEMIANGQSVSFEGVASELQRRLEAHLKRAEERRHKRTGSQTSEAPAAAKSQPGQPAPQAKTISNQLASSTATATTKTMSRAERLAKAEQLLHSFDKR